MLLLGSISLAWASPMFNFDQPSNADQLGTLAWNGPGSDFTGTDIKFDSVTGTDTPAHSGARLSGKGLLNFTLGNYIDSTTSGNTTTAHFGSGGYFTLSGSVGNFSSNKVVDGHWSHTDVSYDTGTHTLNLAGSGFDTKDPQLLAYFGIDPDADFIFANTVISGTINGNPEAGIGTATVANSDLTNTMVPSVPEPGELGLFGFGLLLLGVTLYRRQRFNS
jgi:hypothetical protein